MHLLRPTWFEIDLDAAAENLRAVRRLVGPSRRLFAVVKAGGYGFGSLEAGRAFVAAGADALALADLADAVRLRRGGITVPILVYPNALPDAAADVIAAGLTPTLTDLDAARAYSDAACKLAAECRRDAAPGRTETAVDRADAGTAYAVAPAGPPSASASVGVFVKVDVGLERLGVPADQAVKVIRAIAELPGLRLDGVCTHLHAPATADPEYIRWQFDRFAAVLAALAAHGVDVPVRLAASTPLIAEYPDTWLNAVDPGQMLYGVGRKTDASPVPLRSVFRALKTRVIEAKDLAPRERFGDVAPFPVTAPMRLGVIPIGSGDAFNRLDAGRVLVRGRSVPILARPSLEHTRIDLTAVPDARVGDEVVLIGRQGDEEITIDEVAARHGLDPTQVAPAIGPRVARVYVRGGETIHEETT